MNYTILFSALQDLQSGLFSYKQSAVKENRYVHSFALLAKVVDAMRARRLFAGAREEGWELMDQRNQVRQRTS